MEVLRDLLKESVGFLAYLMNEVLGVNSASFIFAVVLVLVVFCAVLALAWLLTRLRGTGMSGGTTFGDEEIFISKNPQKSL